ncbi:hypothetical protein ENBRE01_1952 [Enteropsectra breve]|nr:hypothetical protein ENBRE01_1952 [Enteropsectra breve]
MPSDTKKSKFKVNNYVLFRNGTEWNEGRIMEINHENGKDFYVVRSFSTFLDTVVGADEPLSRATHDVKRKLKTPLYEGEMVFPVLFKNVLLIDREGHELELQSRSKAVSVANILRAFSDFLKYESGSVTTDEANEATHGFLLAFNTLLPRFLLYPDEYSYYDTNIKTRINPSEVFGSVHLVRLVYFIEKRGSVHVSDNLTKNILLEYCLYLLDFLMLRYDTYFQ